MRIPHLSHSRFDADLYGHKETGDLGGFQCLRRCPLCRKRLFTNHHGLFRCECGFTDYQDVEKYRKAGLDYPVPRFDEYKENLY